MRPSFIPQNPCRPVGLAFILLWLARYSSAFSCRPIRTSASVNSHSLVGRCKSVAFVTEKLRANGVDSSLSSKPDRKSELSKLRAKRVYRRPRSIALPPLVEDEEKESLEGVAKYISDHVMTDDVEEATKEATRETLATTKDDHKEEMPTKLLKKKEDTTVTVSVAEHSATDNDDRSTGKHAGVQTMDEISVSQTDSLAVSSSASQILSNETSTNVESSKPKRLDKEEVDQIFAQFSSKEKTKELSDVISPQKAHVAVLSEEEQVLNDAFDAVEETIDEEGSEKPTFSPETNPSSAGSTQREIEANVVCAKAFAAVNQHPILLFDGACNLCNGWVNFCLDYDVKAEFRYASLQSRVGQSILIRDGRSPDDRSDIILATTEDTYARSDAVLRVISQLEGLPILLRVAATMARIFFPAWFRDAAYKFLSANRHILGDTDGPVCRLDLDGEYFGRFIEDPELEEEYDENLASESEAETFVYRRR